MGHHCTIHPRHHSNSRMAGGYNTAIVPLKWTYVWCLRCKISKGPALWLLWDTSEVSLALTIRFWGHPPPGSCRADPSRAPGWRSSKLRSVGAINVARSWGLGMVGIGLANGFLENGADTLSTFFVKNWALPLWWSCNFWTNNYDNISGGDEYL